MYLDRAAVEYLSAGACCVWGNGGSGSLCRGAKGKGGLVGVGGSIEMRGSGGGGWGGAGCELDCFAAVSVGGGAKPGDGISVEGPAEEQAAGGGGGEVEGYAGGGGA